MATKETLKDFYNKRSLAITARRIENNVRHAVLQESVQLVGRLLAVVKLISSNFFSVFERIDHSDSSCKHAYYTIICGTSACLNLSNCFLGNFRGVSHSVIITCLRLKAP